MVDVIHQSFQLRVPSSQPCPDEVIALYLPGHPQKGALHVDRQAIIDLILDHYESPRHYGAIPDATISQTDSNPGCGDIVTVYLKVDAADRISEISFEGDGCTISQAGASIVTEMFTGKTLADIEGTSANTILDLFGREIAGTRPKCVTLGLNATKGAVRALRQQTPAGRNQT